MPDPIRRLLRIVRRARPGRVAVLRLYGPIAGGGRTADWIETARRLRESDRVPAVVLDVDSGGGSAPASDDLYLALQRLAAKKPLVAAIRGTGASGAYLAALAGHRIIANPTAVVGSIGVLSASPRLHRLLERLGVEVSEHTVGQLKGMGAPWREESEPEAAKEQALVQAFYEAFVDRVAAARGLPRERVIELATGEIWLGRDAVELGLVDEVGDLERAVEIAAGMAHVPARFAPMRARRRLVPRLIDRFASGIGRAVTREIEARFEDRYRT